MEVVVQTQQTDFRRTEWPAIVLWRLVHPLQRVVYDPSVLDGSADPLPLCWSAVNCLVGGLMLIVACVAPAFGQQTLDGSIRTGSGGFLTAVDGGGLGGPNFGPDATALHSDATVPGPWETFTLVWTNPAQCRFAIRTLNNTFVTAVNGGGIGGPNDARSPFHTDAATAREWERFHLILQPDHIHAFIRTPDGLHFVTAVNGGGIGGPNDVPVHTDATKLGLWEEFAFVPSTSSRCDWLVSPPANAQQPPSGTTVPNGGEYGSGSATLMEPGQWTMNVTMNLAGQTSSVTNTQCITPEKVQEIVTQNGNASGQLFGTGQNCQIQQNRIGRRLVSSGQCTSGPMSMRLSSEILFDTPQHLVGSMSQSLEGAQNMATSAQFEGHRIGGCSSQ